MRPQAASSSESGEEADADCADEGGDECSEAESDKEEPTECGVTTLPSVVSPFMLVYGRE